MKQLFFLTTILLFILIGSNAFGQAADSLQPTTLSAPTDSMVIATLPLEGEVVDDDFAPGLLFLTVGALACILLFIGAGIVLTTVGLLILFGLVSFGILSASFMVGLYQKSFAKGFKAFVLLASTVAGILCCSIGAFLFNQVVHWWSPQTAIIAGACCGLLAGLIFGFVANRIVYRLSSYFKQKLNLAEAGFPSA